MSAPVLQSYQSRRMVLNLDRPLDSPEAFNKNIDTQAPLPESYFIDVGQRSGTADSRLFHGDQNSQMARALVILECSMTLLILECSRGRTALKYYGCSVH